MSFKNLGTIKKLRLDEKGYWKLIISVNVPFNTKYIQFNVWKKERLQKTGGELFQIDDQVEIEYYYKDNFPQLTSITETCIEYCPVCFQGLERIETQRMDCNGCSILPYDGQRERLNTQMILKSCTPKPYQYSTGYRLELCPPGWDSSYTCVVFPNKPLLYSIVPDLEVKKLYNILGWRDGNFLDLLDIYESDSS